MASKFVPNPVQVKRQPLSMAYRLVTQTARRVEMASKIKAPVRKPNENGRLGGRLRASIGTKITTKDYRVTARIGTRVKYAEAVNRGARRHPIYPRRKQFLSFKWNKAARYGIPLTRRGKVQLRSVNHPGMKGTEFLTDPLRTIARREGFRVTTVRKIR